MTPELAQKKLDYWCEKLDLYEYVEILAAAQEYPILRAIVKRLGYKVPKKKMKLKKTLYLPASDGWFPCYRGGKVAVYFKDNRISVWGNDDFGMDLEPATQQQYDELIAAPISVERCKKMGFKNC